MRSFQDQYQELVAFAQLYLFQEYTVEEWLIADSKTHQEFREYARQQKSQSASAPLPIPLKVENPTTPAITPPTVKSPPTYVEKPKNSIQASLPKSPPSPPPLSSPQTVPAFQASNKLFNLEPLSGKTEIDFSSIRKYMQEKCPNQLILNEIPSDTEAKKIKNQWQMPATEPEIIILAYNEGPKQLIFLENIAKAIQQLSVHAVVISAHKIEQEKGWESLLKSGRLRLVISSHHGMQILPGLMKHYNEIAKQGKQFLDRIPLCLLTDVSIYIKEPKLKIPLWQSIKNFL
jgi:hypothetical protein